MSELQQQPIIDTPIDDQAIADFCSKIPNKRVLVYIPTGTEFISSYVVEGIFELLWDCSRWQKYGFEFIPVVGKRMPLPNARNMGVEFAREHGCGYILWMDDDMVIVPGTNAFGRLLMHDKDMVAPLFFTRIPPFLPCLFKRRFRADGRFCTFENIADYEKNKLIKVDGVGFGLVLTKMSIYDKINNPCFLYGDGFGEDLYFCSKAIDSGVEIFVDTSFDVGHVGLPNIVFEGTFNAYKESATEFIKQKIASEDEQAKKFEMKCDIVMPCYHNFTTTKNSIESILNFSKGVEFNLILINDGADKDLSKYFKRLSLVRPNITVVTNEKNIGWIKAVNQGIALAKTKYVLMINNDIVIEPDFQYWLARMVSELMVDDRCGAVGVTSNFVMGIQSVAYNEQIPIPVHYAKFLIGFCMMVKKDVLDKVGGLDERFGLGGEDDLDISIRIRKAGYNLKVTRDVFVRHIGFQSLGMIFKDYKEIEDKLRPLLVEKWGKETIDELFEISQDFLVKGRDLK